MSSAIHNLQKAILDSGQSLTQLLRQAKLIAAKLNVRDVETWVDLELKGYPPEVEPPEYRKFSTESLTLHNPYRGWVYGGDLRLTLKSRYPIADIENLSRSETLSVPIPLGQNLAIRDSMGGSTGSDWPQRLTTSGSKFRNILEAVRNELLQWTIDLEKRGIKGESMNFDENEKQSAGKMIFNIGTVQGMVGNVTGSQVNFHDYSSVHQLLLDCNIPREARHELEDIMDELKKTPPEKQRTLIARAEKWIVKHKEVLGTAAEIIGKALGVGIEQPPKH